MRSTQGRVTPGRLADRLFGISIMPAEARRYSMAVGYLGLLLLTASAVVSVAHLLHFILNDHRTPYRLIIVLAIYGCSLKMPKIRVRNGQDPVVYRFTEFALFVGVALLPWYLLPFAAFTAEAPMWFSEYRRVPQQRSRWPFRIGAVMLNVSAISTVAHFGPAPYSYLAAAVGGDIVSTVLVSRIIALTERNPVTLGQMLRSKWDTRGVAIASAMVVWLLNRYMVNAADLLFVLPVVYVLAYRGIVRWLRLNAERDMLDNLNKASGALVGNGVDETVVIERALRFAQTILPIEYAELTFYRPIVGADDSVLTAYQTFSLRSGSASIIQSHEGDGEVIRSQRENRNTLTMPLFVSGDTTDRKPLGHFAVHFNSTATGHGSGFFSMAAFAFASNAHRENRNRIASTFAASIESSITVARMYQAVSHQAQHDALTSLGNRAKLYETGPDLIERSQRLGGVSALLLLDLDGFKRINDTLGHHVGDAVIKEVGSRILAVVRDTDIAVRLGGDEFAILATQLAHADDAHEVAAKILGAIGHAVIVDEMPLPVEGSIGVAVYGEDGDSVPSLLKAADVAMYQAKATGHDQVVRYNRALHCDNFDLQLHADLREALATRRGLILHYQPQVDLKTKKVCGMEALVRWEHPTLGLLYPDKFIALAEQTGMIRPFTLQVIEMAIRDHAKLRKLTSENLTMSVNLSALNLMDQALPGEVAKLLAQYNVPAHEMVMEITETATPSDTDQAGRTLIALSKLGCSISIDDFGDGYASLKSLDRDTFDEVKIDKHFVQKMVERGGALSMVKGIIAIAHAHECEVVAEGVEDEATFDLLVAAECDRIQGYYIARPQALDRVTGWLTMRGEFGRATRLDTGLIGAGAEQGAGALATVVSLAEHSPMSTRQAQAVI